MLAKNIVFVNQLISRHGTAARSVEYLLADISTDDSAAATILAAECTRLERSVALHVHDLQAIENDVTSSAVVASLVCWGAKHAVTAAAAAGDATHNAYVAGLANAADGAAAVLAATIPGGPASKAANWAAVTGVEAIQKAFLVNSSGQAAVRADLTGARVVDTVQAAVRRGVLSAGGSSEDAQTACDQVARSVGPLPAEVSDALGGR